jgi:hypothetical protein
VDVNESDLRDLLPDERPLPAERRREMEERLVKRIEAQEKTSRKNFRLLVGAAAAAVIVGGVVGVVAAGDDGGDHSGQLGAVDECADEPCPPDIDQSASGAPTAAVVDLVTAPRDLVIALQDERDTAWAELIGQADLVASPFADAEDARRRTDAAVAGLQALVDAGTFGSAYQPALDDLDGLAALRGDADADDGPRDLSNIEAADDIFDRYGQLVTGLLDAQEAFVATIDDPDLRAGADLYQLSLHQQELTKELGRNALLVVVQPDEAAVTDLNQLYELLLAGNDTLVAQATGTPYEDVTTAGVGELQASGFLANISAVIEGSPNVPDLLTAIDTMDVQGWPVVLDDIEHRLSTED